MHHGGGSAGRPNLGRFAAGRQRGVTALAYGTTSCVFVKTFHSRARMSADAVTMCLPSGLNAAFVTPFSWPLSGSQIGLPVSESHSRTVLSSDAVTMRLPSGLNAAEYTKLVWPLSAICLPVSVSHSRAV